MLLNWQNIMRYICEARLLHSPGGSPWSSICVHSELHHGFVAAVGAVCGWLELLTCTTGCRASAGRTTSNSRYTGLPSSTRRLPSSSITAAMPLYDLQLTWGTTTGCADFVAAVGALPIGFAAVLLAALARDVNVVCCAAAGMSDPLACHSTSCCTLFTCASVRPFADFKAVPTNVVGSLVPIVAMALKYIQGLWRLKCMQCQQFVHFGTCCPR